MNLKQELNLQLFATTMTTETGSLSAEMKTFYEKRLLDQAEPLLVHNQFGDKYPIPAGSGKKIEFRKYSALPKALTALTEGVTPAGNSLNVTTVEGTVKQYGDWIQLSDMLQMTAIDNNVVQATKLLSSQAGRTLDTVTREVLAGGTNVIYAPKVVDPPGKPRMGGRGEVQGGEQHLLRGDRQDWRCAGGDHQRGEGHQRQHLPGGGGQHLLQRVHLPAAGGQRLRRNDAGKRRLAAHCQAAGLRRGSAEPALQLRLEGHLGGGAPVRGIHGAH